MLVIRLRRVGKKNKPTYRVVVAEHTYPIDGKFTADLGFYNPHTKVVKIDQEKAKDWMNKGAQPSNTIAKLLQKEKVKHPSIVVKTKHRKPKGEQPAEKQVVSPEPQATDQPVTENEPTETAEATPESTEEPTVTDA